MKTGYYLVTVFIILMVAIFLTACENAPTGQQYAFEDDTPVTLLKPASYSYPIWGKKNFYNKNGLWGGGSITLSNGSKFTIPRGAMTPPVPGASSNYLTVRADYDSLRNEIVVSFTPSGCVFNPPAELILDWSDLGIETASLFYIDENGNYIPQSPDNIDIQKKKMTLYIDHFSRYAIGMD